MLRRTIAAVTLLLSATSLAAPLEITETRTVPLYNNTHCDKGVRIWSVRGSTAIYDSNWTYKMARNVTRHIPYSEGYDLPYPATNSHNYTGYAISLADGYTMLTTAIERYVHACPGHKIAIIGFSQGSQVVGDVLLGPPGSKPSQALAPQYRAAIVAIAMFGDPCFVANQTWDRGTSRSNGVIPRADYANWAKFGYAPRLHSWCDAGDMYCASGDGSNALEIHNSYGLTYNHTAALWMETMIHLHLNATS